MNVESVVGESSSFLYVTEIVNCCTDLHPNERIYRGLIPLTGIEGEGVYVILATHVRLHRVSDWGRGYCGPWVEEGLKAGDQGTEHPFLARIKVPGNQFHTSVPPLSPWIHASPLPRTPSIVTPCHCIPTPQEWGNESPSNLHHRDKLSSFNPQNARLRQQRSC